MEPKGIRVKARSPNPMARNQWAGNGIMPARNNMVWPCGDHSQGINVGDYQHTIQKFRRQLID
ncbi:Galactose oxidase [Corchorus olitorius]|uniref:Galactose oxidase n=1 Tax=Corchorus olitorius TaxID=93759 RepID=A0A1R3GKC1_9ROSI|nr:Galactose oxidase [Corchorus olitorius]